MMRVRVVSLVLTLALAVPSVALAAEPAKKKPSIDCTGMAGFITCAVVGNVASSCLTPWGDCNKRWRKLACEVTRDAARNAWAEQQRRGIQGPPPLEASKQC